MVRFSTSLIVAGVVIHGLAAPIFENREKSVKLPAFHEPQNGERIGPKIASTSEMKTERKKRFEQKGEEQVSSGPHQLERRFGRIGMVRHHGFHGSESGRSNAVMSTREIDVEELQARDPRISSSHLRTIGHGIRGGVELAATVAPLFNQRSLEDEPGVYIIYTREPRISGAQLRTIGHHVKSGVEFAANVAPLLQQRSEELEIDAREPFNFGHFLKGAAKGAGKIAGTFLKREDAEGDEMYARGLDDDELDLEAREPEPFNFGHFLKGAAKDAGKVAGTFLKREDIGDGVLDARELYDAEFELEAREPEPFNFGHFLKGAAKGAGRVAGTFLKREDLEDADVLAREFDVNELEELAARDPFFLTKILKGATKVASKFIRREDDNGVVYARGFQIDELD